ncbi:MAG TPA: PQQ-binding-like beta-propeller repeat protein [Terriglobia bacterium]|nr:PQQ-binding-like beta-propeller repeat protein [Terriglobia bacterium]
MRYVCFVTVMMWVLLVGVSSAQDGAAIYKERCASCHDMPEGRTPALSAIKAMSGEAIYVALTSGAMKTQAQGLSTAQIFMLLGHIAPTGGASEAPSLTPTCKGTAPFGPSAFKTAMSAARWNGWSTAVTNTRFQDTGDAGLIASNVSRLKIRWAFNLGNITMTRSQPTIAGGRVFIGSLTGVVYALDANSGCTHWAYKAVAAIRSGVTMGSANGTPAVFFGDSSATVHALNAETGALIWKNRPVDHFTTVATAAPQVHNGVVYQPFSSFEEALAGDPSYECCSFRGSVVALDAATGKKIWQTFTISDVAKATRKTGNHQEYGPSGAGIWSTPTIDEKLNALYVSTGDNYSDPATTTSDAILAINLKTGALLWSRQFTQNDAYNVGCTTPSKVNCPKPEGPDFDFGQPPILVDLGGGKRALVIAQKSGMVHAIDPDNKGAVLWQKRASKGGYLGGSQWGSAADSRNVYVATSDLAVGAVADATSPQGFRLNVDPKTGGGLHALDLQTGATVWDAKPSNCPPGQTLCSPAQSAAVTVIPGVVFSGSVDGHLRAYSTSTGEVLWDVDTAREFETVNGKPARGGSIDVAGPAIVNGMVFVNSGYGQWGGMPGNVLLVFSVDGK